MAYGDIVIYSCKVTVKKMHGHLALQCLKALSRLDSGFAGEGLLLLTQNYDLRHSL